MHYFLLTKQCSDYFLWDCFSMTNVLDCQLTQIYCCCFQCSPNAQQNYRPTATYDILSGMVVSYRLILFCCTVNPGNWYGRNIAYDKLNLIYNSTSRSMVQLAALWKEKWNITEEEQNYVLLYYNNYTVWKKILIKLIGPSI